MSASAEVASRDLDAHLSFPEEDLDWSECGYCGTRGTVQSDTVIDQLTDEYAVFDCWYCNND